MKDFLCSSVYFGVAISLIGYGSGVFLKKKLKFAFLNPLLISILFVIAVISILDIGYDTYEESTRFLSYMLTPATVCLAVPLYQQIELLKKNLLAVTLGILSGVLTSLVSVLMLAAAFGLDHQYYVTLLPKSITTAIGMGVSEELGGIVTITVAVIVVTGVFGNIIGDLVFRIFKIYDPVAQGLALGTSAHAIGTAKALEMGEVQAAMSSLSLAVAGLLTVAGASIFANFI